MRIKYSDILFLSGPTLRPSTHTDASVSTKSTRPATSRRRVGLPGCSREQVSGRHAAIWPPLLRDGEHFNRGGKVIKLVRALDHFAQSEVARENDILSSEGEDQCPLGGPRANPRDRRQLRDDVVV